MKLRIYSVAIAAILSLAYAQSPASQQISKSDFDRMMTDLSNWGRWGKTDEKGTINLITPAKRHAAAGLVTAGVSVSLARDTDSTKTVDNPNPFGHTMSPPVADQFNMDEYSVFFHGFAVTHFDSLSHVFYNGKMYNGFPQSSVTSGGAGKLAVTAFQEGIFTRGVLIDIPWLKGVKYLANDARIYPEDLDQWQKKTGVHIQSGDAVFVRIGRWAERADKGPWDIGSASAGLYATTARWFKQRDIAILGGDASNDAIPSGIQGVDYPMHSLLLVAMGTPMLDQCDLEELSRTAIARNRWTFLLTVAPIRAAGGTGAPVNPIAVF
jgi:kynurenine formamidase